MLSCSVVYNLIYDLMNCSPPGFSVYGISQARILKWVAMPSSQGIFLTQGSNPHLLYLLHWQVGSLPLATWEALVRQLKVPKVLKFVTISFPMS